MSSAVIIGGGDFPRKEYPRELIRRADYIVCCDGHALSAFMRNRSRIFDSPAQAALPQEGSGPAAKTLHAGGRLPDAVVGDLPNTETLPAGGRLPDAVVGDMDSVSARQLSEFSSLLVKVEEQDDNDQTKAFNHILRSYPDVDTIHIVAATGKRECHTIGNMGLLMRYYRQMGVHGVMFTDHGSMTPASGHTEFRSFKGQQVSIFNFGSRHLASQGLKWQSYAYDEWWQGTLNEALGNSFSIHADGCYLVYQTYEAKSLPQP
jgi:thiamine pyrophosphokinase